MADDAQAKSAVENDDEDDRREERPAATRAPAPSAGFFSFYKPGQGYWTRLCTALGAAVLVGYTCHWMFQQLRSRDWLDPVTEFPKWTLTVICVFVLAAVVTLWRLMNKPSIVDFFIATESEMKKVNWTSRKDLIGSTRVVVIFMFLIAAVLFVFDLVFGWFFYLIDVLHTKPF